MPSNAFNYLLLSCQYYNQSAHGNRNVNKLAAAADTSRNEIRLLISDEIFDAVSGQPASEHSCIRPYLAATQCHIERKLRGNSLALQFRNIAVFDQLSKLSLIIVIRYKRLPSSPPEMRCARVRKIVCPFCCKICVVGLGAMASILFACLLRQAQRIRILYYAQSTMYGIREHLRARAYDT